MFFRGVMRDGWRPAVVRLRGVRGAAHVRARDKTADLRPLRQQRHPARALQRLRTRLCVGGPLLHRVDAVLQAALLWGCLHVVTANADVSLSTGSGDLTIGAARRGKVSAKGASSRA